VVVVEVTAAALVQALVQQVEQQVLVLVQVEQGEVQALPILQVLLVALEHQFILVAVAADLVKDLQQQFLAAQVETMVEVAAELRLLVEAQQRVLEHQVLSLLPTPQ
jgi:predicted AAA+ superfamily ATPase